MHGLKWPTTCKKQKVNNDVWRRNSRIAKIILLKEVQKSVSSSYMKHNPKEDITKMTGIIHRQWMRHRTRATEPPTGSLATENRCYSMLEETYMYIYIYIADGGHWSSHSESHFIANNQCEHTPSSEKINRSILTCIFGNHRFPIGDFLVIAPN